jgi:hypothetical protein
VGKVKQLPILFSIIKTDRYLRTVKINRFLTFLPKKILPNDRSNYVTTVDNNGLRNLRIQSITDDEIRVVIPILSAGKYKITVTVLQSSVTYDTPFTYYK